MEIEGHNVIDLYDNGDTLLLVVNNARERYLIKEKIKEVNVVRGTIVKIDIALGALKCIYIDSLNVRTPEVEDAFELRDSILEMLGKSTLTEVKSQLATLNDKQFYEPTKIDAHIPGVTFRGYAPVGKSDGAKEYWAIQIVKVLEGQTTVQWAGGKQTFDKIWNERESYSYS